MCVLLLQLEELLTQVIPGSSLSELAALECIIASLLQQGKLAANTATVMYGLMVRNICEYYTQLEQLPADALQHKQQDAPAAAATAAVDDADEDRMETDGENPEGAAASSAAAATAAAAVADAEKAAMLVSVLRHCFTLLSMLTAAQPSLLDPQFVPALLEVGFSARLAVSTGMLK
jgi:hypothetical protein